jgi:hypothetical protein
MLIDLLLDNRTLPGKLVSTAAVRYLVGRSPAASGWSSAWRRPGWPSPCSQILEIGSVAEDASWGEGPPAHRPHRPASIRHWGVDGLR